MSLIGKVKDFEEKKDFKDHVNWFLRDFYETLVKYFYLGSEPTTWNKASDIRSYWTRQLQEQFNVVPILPGAKKFPEADFIFKCIFPGKLDETLLRKKQILNIFVEQYRKIRKTTDAEFRDFCENYCRKLSELLSTEGFASIDDINDILEEITKNNEQ